MNQSQHKRKPEADKKGGKRPSSKLAQKESDVTQEELARAELWKAEIESLLGQEFSNMGEALHSLVGKVLARLGLEGKARQETHDYLMLLLDTDEEIKEELGRVIKVKR